MWKLFFSPLLGNVFIVHNFLLLINDVISKNKELLLQIHFPNVEKKKKLICPLV